MAGDVGDGDIEGCLEARFVEAGKGAPCRYFLELCPDVTRTTLGHRSQRVGLCFEGRREWQRQFGPAHRELLLEGEASNATCVDLRVGSLDLGAAKNAGGDPADHKVTAVKVNLALGSLEVDLDLDLAVVA